MKKSSSLVLIVCLLLSIMISAFTVEVLAAGDGGKIYEAEDASSSAGTIVATEHQGYTGLGFVDYNPNKPGGYLEWIVDVPKAGEYELQFRYASGASENRPAEIKVNGHVVEPNLAFNPTGAWDSWKQTQTVTTLRAGKNVIRATATGSSGGANIDHLKLEYNSNYFDQILEAEKAKGSGTIVGTEHEGYTGTGFVDYKPNQPGGYLEWTVDIPAAGKYTLQFRYGNGASANRPAEIKVNGDVVEPNLAFDSTGAWDNWVTTETTVNLQAGKNVIRATATGASGGANIDHLRVCYAFDELLEAEDVSSSAGTIVATQHKGYTGTGFVDYKPNQPGGYLEWTADIPVDGKYMLQFRYGNGASANRPAEIKVNGDIVEPELAFDSTGAWDNWQLTQATVVLNKGENVIRATGTGSSGGANIDHLRILSANMIQQNVDPLAKSIEVVEASDIVNKLVLDELSRKGLFVDGQSSQAQVEKKAEAVTIKSAQALSANLVLVTLDGAFKDFDVNNVRIAAPQNDWDALNPDLTDYLLIKQAAVGTNKEGNTAIIYQLAENLDENARLNTKKEPQVTMDKEAAKKAALDIVSWQMDHGGWDKHMEEEYKTRWNGKAKRSHWFGTNGEELGTIDNDATITQMRFIAKVYRETKMPELKKSFLKGLDFLYKLQYPTGGFAQVYPRRGRPDQRIYYSNFVTFNDGAMINVMNLLDDIASREYPFDGDLLDRDNIAKVEDSLAKGVDFILKSQIKVDGKLTAWCAQHDPKTYEPRYARSYEHPSISGKESVGIVKFLMARPNQTPEIKRAVNGALKWFEEVKLENVKYVRNDPLKIFFYDDVPNSNTWYRFYDLKTMEPIFSGRDGVIKHDLRKVEEERQYGYSWGGDYAQALLDVVNSIGYYGRGRVYAKVMDDDTKDKDVTKLKDGKVELVKKLDLAKAEAIAKIVVAKDNSGDYKTVQAAIDAVPENNIYPVEIFIKDGIYKEVVNIPSSKPFIRMIGESKEGTVLTYDNYNKKKKPAGGTYGTTGSASAFLYADNFVAKNLTFENSFDEASVAGGGTQAVAVKTQGDKMYFENVRFIGNQDTLYTSGGRQYFNNCYIEGDVDFIFGDAQAVFDNCQIYSLDRGSSSNNGYVTAASTSIKEPYGYLFINSTLLSNAPDGTVYLGRPWHPGGDKYAIASVVFRDSYLGAHIKARPWTDMSGFKAENARFYEYNNSGPGAVVNSSRNQLTAKEAQKYTIENVLAGWNPNQ
ncbi:PelA/Pel-15E family pectate lyase [Orenia metallireducens]|uniref:Pectate lyase, PelA/Pel-15E family n=1 Tax=Orenia metallireducens TaxID=1413210 RepID=A0A285GAY6_9FIRM|nr:pectate lyase [Orenia metallireducens]PRX28273.1 PelA/Pel-15E family pectate lyase [Orenia metallireducens]SNY19571.1 pectate lyase, PelA/Pel-15E family [Orenia metallireducens]